MDDDLLLEQFVDSFEKFEELVLWERTATEKVLAELGLPATDQEPKKWRPLRVCTDTSALQPLYDILPASLPPLYERFVLSYRWLDVVLGDVVTLYANPPGDGLRPLLARITTDPIFVQVLFPLGLIPFGNAWDGSYDPVCFDTSRRRKNGDCPVVRIEHESVLCHERVGQQWPVASSFRELVQRSNRKCRREAPARSRLAASHLAAEMRLRLLATSALARTGDSPIY